MNAISKTSPTRAITMSSNLGTEDDPLKIDIERSQITIEADGGALTRNGGTLHYVTLTFEQFEKVAAEYGYFTRLTQQKDVG